MDRLRLFENVFTESQAADNFNWKDTINSDSDLDWTWYEIADTTEDFEILLSIAKDKELKVTPQMKKIYDDSVKQDNEYIEKDDNYFQGVEDNYYKLSHSAWIPSNEDIRNLDKDIQEQLNLLEKETKKKNKDAIKTRIAELKGRKRAYLDMQSNTGNDVDENADLYAKGKAPDSFNDWMASAKNKGYY